MGVFDDVQRESKRILTHRPSRATGSANHTKSTEKFFRKLPVLIRARVCRPAVRAAGTIVRKEVRRNLKKTGARSYNALGAVSPDNQPIGRSRVTGTYSKWSASVRAKRKNNEEMVNLIRSRNWTAASGAIVGNTTGPLWRQAAQGHILEFGGVINLWGGANKVKKTARLPPRPFLRAAGDTTLPKQKAAIIKAMKSIKTKLQSSGEISPEIDGASEI